MAPRTEKEAGISLFFPFLLLSHSFTFQFNATAFRNLKIIQVTLSILVFALAAALKVVIILYIQGKTDHLAKAKVFNEALKRQNQILTRRLSDSGIVHGGNFYYFSCGEMSWDEAEHYCASSDSQLTSVTSVEEQDFLHKNGNAIKYWIGLKNQTRLGWTWTDGTPYDQAKSQKFWAKEKPQNEKDNDCVIFEANKQKSWDNLECKSTFRFICKWYCDSSGMCRGIPAANS